MGYCDEHSHDPMKCNTARFSKPMPWIGIYIATASLVCSLAMAADVLRGFRRRKLWFPCKFFTLNVASLTVLAVALKLPMDLNNPMPGLFDQLSKLSSLYFMATAMANLMPSLGDMDSKDVTMNLIALGILLVTVLVNVSIQLGTGLLFAFVGAHVFAIIFAFNSFSSMSCSALVVPTTKKVLERKYRETSEKILAESVEGGGEYGVERLKEDVRKYWLMAESCNPQFVIVRSPMCFASAVICCLSAIILSEVFARSLIFQRFTGNVQFEGREHSSSDYQATTYVIFFIQFAGVVIGSLAPLFRCFFAVKMRCCSSGRESSFDFSLEKYWIERIEGWIDRPLPLHLGGRYTVKAINKLKDMVLCLCIQFHIMTVVICKIVLLCCVALVRLLVTRFIGHEQHGTRDPDLTRYVLHLEGEDQLPQAMAGDKNALCRFIEKGANQQPDDLAKLLRKTTINFCGVARLDSSQVISLNSVEPPNCWKLLVVTLTTIAIEIPRIHCNVLENLIRGVTQGLEYISIVDEILAGTGGPYTTVRDAADVAWSEVIFSLKFLNKDIGQMARDNNTPQDVLAKLRDIAADYVKKCGISLADDCTNWPAKVVAANSMYRISQSLLTEFESNNNEELFQYISVMIADTLGACLTNLPKAIITKCSSVSIEKSEETVQDMARMIGEMEEILKMLREHCRLPDLAHDKRIDVEEWRRLLITSTSPRQVLSSLLITSSRASTSSDAEVEIIIDTKS